MSKLYPFRVDPHLKNTREKSNIMLDEGQTHLLSGLETIKRCRNVHKQLLCTPSFLFTFSCPVWCLGQDVVNRFFLIIALKFILLHINPSLLFLPLPKILKMKMSNSFLPGNPLVGWLVGCFGFNGPLRQYFSLYRAVSQREGEREEKGQMRVKMSKQPPPAPTASAAGPCPTVIQIVGRPGTGS